MDKEPLQDKQTPSSPDTPIKSGKKSEEEKKPTTFSATLIGQIADEVSKTLMTRLPSMLPRKRTKKSSIKKQKKLDYGLFLDTSAIIDNRIFDVIGLGLLNGVIVLLPSILLELKHLADTQNTVKRERGRKGLEALERLKKTKKMKVIILSEEEERQFKGEVDEKLIKAAKAHKGKVITCDYNLEKKASVENVTAINMNALANCLKIIAVPGDSLHVDVAHKGKDPTQGVGYLDDGTMLVIEKGSEFLGKTIDVVVSRVIQTASGKILFAKKI